MGTLVLISQFRCFYFNVYRPLVCCSPSGRLN